MTIILGIALIVALIAITFLLIFYVFNGDDTDKGEEVVPPIATVPSEPGANLSISPATHLTSVIDQPNP